MRRKKYIYLFYYYIFICIGSLPLIFAEDLTSYDYLKIEINNNINYGITKHNEAIIDELSLKSYFFPTNYNESQFLNSFESTNSYSIENADTTPNLFFNIKDKTSQQNTISNTFIVQSFTHKPKISQKYIFPQKLDSKYEEYLSFSELIDTNDAIYAQASKLAQGEDDTYIIASKIAKWIQEDIIYDLSTITENPNQKSSQVFISKTGVCKEITHLYISMMRSLGIPARVVTGYAYTNSVDVIDLVGSNWGGHAWAEVLIGETWVPFDLTYNQYGYVDASHIVLDKSKEIRKQSALIEGRGRNFEITKNSLKNENSFKIIEKKKEIDESGFNIQIEGPRELSPQSFGHIKITVENTKEYYQNIFLNLAKVNEIELLDLQEQMIILKPLEKKEILFRYKIPKLDSGFIYTFPFTIYNEFFEETIEVTVKEGNQEIKEYELPKINIRSQSFSNNTLDFSCTGEVNFPNNLLLCTITNPNNFELFNVKICSPLKCQNIDLKVNEQKSIELQSQTFETQISVEYQDKKEITIISIPKPTFLKNSINISKQNIIVSYSIENYYQTIFSEIVINPNLEKKLHSRNINETFKLNPGNYTVIVKIMNGNQSIETFAQAVTIEELSLLDKIKEFFSKLFLLLF